jgi:hypothetical protein
MIFRPELAKKIAAGEKTMTRRPVKDGEKDCRYKPNRVYAVQPGRGRPANSQITVTEVREERLGDLSLRDAKREGFRTTQAFVDYWSALYGHYDAEQLVWVISFVKGDATDTPRLLAARPGGPGGDYTANPARAAKGEPEAVSASLQEKFSQRAREQHTATKRGDWREQRDRLMAVVREIRAHAVDPKAAGNLRGIERQIASLDRKMSTPA